MPTTDPGADATIEIRSYRTVFELERRLYRIDRLRLPPGGVPMRGALYSLALIAAAVVTSRLPLLAAVGAVLPWYLRDLALPIATAALLALVRIEGRPFHLAARSLARHRLGPRWWRGLRPARPPAGRWHPPDLLMLPDGSEARCRSFAYRGPGAVLVAGGHECRGRPLGWLPALLRRPHVTVREGGDPGTVDRRAVVLGANARLRVRPRRGAWRR